MVDALLQERTDDSGLPTDSEELLKLFVSKAPLLSGPHPVSQQQSRYCPRSCPPGAFHRDLTVAHCYHAQPRLPRRSTAGRLCIG